MTSTFFGFNIARRGMSAHKAALDVTAHNVANASTQGYSRQQAVFTTTSPFNTASSNKSAGAGQIGTGVTIGEIRRVRDGFLDHQLRPQLSKQGYWEERHAALSTVEMVVMEPGDTGLSKVWERFWGAWQELSKNPTSGAARAGVVETGITLATSLNSTAVQAETIRDDLNTKTRIAVTDMNSITKQIAGLNKQVVANIGAGLNPNDLLDRRDALLDDLSKITQFTALFQPNGGVDVAIGGRHLVQESRHVELKTVMDGLYAVPAWEDNTHALIEGGSLAGIASTRQWVQENFYDKINTLTDALVTKLNTAHGQGKSMTGATGEDFFEYSADPVAGREARFIVVNPDIVNDHGLIAAADDSAPLGDGSNALAIARLRNDPMFGLGTSSLEVYYSGIVTGVGVETQQAERMALNQDALTNQIINRREEASGVSIDEEMAYMLQFQHGYQAAARLLSTVDEILQTLINLGR